tara:strand:- start:221 stop:400 length:180 start_codon:yes stop_codon:yes gene_type:complete
MTRIDLTITRESADDSRDIDVRVHVSEGCVARFGETDNGDVWPLTEAERDQVRDIWERM